MPDSLAPQAQTYTGYVIGLSLGTQRVAYCVLDMGTRERRKPCIVSEDVSKIGRQPATDSEDVARRLYGHETLLAVIYDRYPPDCVVVGSPSERPGLRREVCSGLFRGVSAGKIIWAQEPRALELLDKLRENNTAQLQRLLAARLDNYPGYRLEWCVNAAAAACAGAEHMLTVRTT